MFGQYARFADSQPPIIWQELEGAFNNVKPDPPEDEVIWPVEETQGGLQTRRVQLGFQRGDYSLQRGDFNEESCRQEVPVWDSTLVPVESQPGQAHPSAWDLRHQNADAANQAPAPLTIRPSAAAPVTDDADDFSPPWLRRPEPLPIRPSAAPLTSTTIRPSSAQRKASHESEALLKTVAPSTTGRSRSFDRLEHCQTAPALMGVEQEIASAARPLVKRPGSHLVTSPLVRRPGSPLQSKCDPLFTLESRWHTATCQTARGIHLSQGVTPIGTCRHLTAPRGQEGIGTPYSPSKDDVITADSTPCPPVSTPVADVVINPWSVKQLTSTREPPKPTDWLPRLPKRHKSEVGGQTTMSQWCFGFPTWPPKDPVTVHHPVPVPVSEPEPMLEPMLSEPEPLLSEVHMLANGMPANTEGEEYRASDDEDICLDRPTNAMVDSEKASDDDMPVTKKMKTDVLDVDTLLYGDNLGTGVRDLDFDGDSDMADRGSSKCLADFLLQFLMALEGDSQYDYPLNILKY